VKIDGQLEQQWGIRMVLERYFNALDQGDFTRLATCFTPDVDFEFNLETRFVVHGRDALIERLRGMPRPTASNHALSNTSIMADGDTAHATTFAIVHVFLGETDGGKVLVRGLRYDDRLVYEDGVWCIAARRHQPLWQHETVSVPLGISQ
jgi:hypothetical protein